ncbi:MAG: glycosyltransferase [Bacteroidota bacterium]
MISFIISSYREDYFRSLTESIEDTTTCSYEIIRIENKGLYSLSQAYNQGAAKAKYEFLCFIHEDVLIHTPQWNQFVLQRFDADERLGIVGLAGSQMTTNLPIGWTTGLARYDKRHLLQRFRDGRSVLQSTQDKGALFDEVEVLDGLLLFTRKTIWEKYRFDEEIGGFHFYDLDFSKRVANDYKLCISYAIVIEHFSEGTFDSNWLQASLEYHTKHNKSLTHKPNRDHLRIIRKTWYTHLGQYDISLVLKLRFLVAMGTDWSTMKQAVKFLFSGVIRLSTIRWGPRLFNP